MNEDHLKLVELYNKEYIKMLNEDYMKELNETFEKYKRDIMGY